MLAANVEKNDSHVEASSVLRLTQPSDPFVSATLPRYPLHVSAFDLCLVACALRPDGGFCLENNHLTGSILDLNASPLDQFNVSSNQLNGSIPARFSRLDASSFPRNSLYGKPLQECPGTESGKKKKKKKKLSGGAIAGIVIGFLVGLLLILLLLFFLCRKSNSKDKSSSDTTPGQNVEAESPQEKTTRDIENAGAGISATSRGSDSKDGRSKRLVSFGNVSKVFDLEDLLRALAEVQGKGTFGTTYKATLEMGMVVAVKRLKDVTATKSEFREKIEVVGKMVYENLVTLTAKKNFLPMITCPWEAYLLFYKA